MSELSKLRDRWIRHERQIAKLEAEIELVADYEAPEILEKILAAKARLAATIELTHAEELRLLQPDTKLVFKLQPRKEKATKAKRSRAPR